MSELFKKDITLRIVSVLIAIILWYNVLDKNANPISTTSINIQLNVLNENSLLDKGIGLKDKNFPHVVQLTFKGRKDKIDSIGPNDFQAQIDIADIKSTKDNELLVEITKSKADITVESIKPSKIKLNLENITQNSFKVDVKTVGNLSRNYRILKTTVVPDTVTVKDYDSIVKSISKTGTTVDISNLDKDLTIQQPCKFYNSKGEEITSLKNTATVIIKVEVAKEVSVIPDVKGNPAKNYINTENTVIPDKVLITGKPELLNTLSELRTDTVNIENMNSNMSFKSHLKLPVGVKFVDSSNETVTVNTTIEEVAKKDITITKDNIEISGREIDNSLNYEIQTESILISLKGKASTLENINIDSLNPNIDVSGLVDGIYNLTLNLSLPDDVRPVQSYEISVKIDKR